MSDLWSPGEELAASMLLTLGIALAGLLVLLFVVGLLLLYRERRRRRRKGRSTKLWYRN